MRTKLTVFLLLMGFSLNAAAQDCLSDFRVRRAWQQSPMWCWAATLQMIINFHDPSSDASQCDIVEDYFDVEDCEEAEFSGGYMNKMKDFLEDNDLGATFTCDLVNRPLSVNEIVDNILDCKPIIISIRPSPFSSIGHVVVIMGIWQRRDAYGNPWTEVVLRDPYPYSWNSVVSNGFTGVEYSRLRSVWISSIYNIDPD
ncbi:papain-like cysteine protease family protein [Chitinophaga sp. 22620]|uniref:papain-like cysteine protease family protein n=1 Tax=Chitinophaga sp. 22620 TaxID=3453952 RepID=UPI003F842A3B